ncbi:hypothetical protein GDO78_010080 [Eleutherodactylus coqui]|uniref:Uncharacterized protein n=1 Tax=Eleutherodactylus coqui TaxID=57060 RepID=A0A8J6FBE6_ELECQ|nr:hypothetical protein GDO78_010080 [Eleutherodactylus coqui]
MLNNKSNLIKVKTNKMLISSLEFAKNQKSSHFVFIFVGFTIFLKDFTHKIVQKYALKIWELIAYCWHWALT